MIKFTDTIWLNVEPYKVTRIDIDTVAFEDLTENACFYVTVTLCDGKEENSDYFKTFDEARACAEKFIRALESED